MYFNFINNNYTYDVSLQQNVYELMNNNYSVSSSIDVKIHTNNFVSIFSENIHNLSTDKQIEWALDKLSNIYYPYFIKIKTNYNKACLLYCNELFTKDKYMILFKLNQKKDKWNGYKREIK